MPTPEATRAEVRLSLPWPDRNLSPNARCHWAVKAKAVKSARNCARVLTLQALKFRKPRWTAATLHWEFHPKTTNKVDGDNAESACKAFRDGIADALGMDDANFTTSKQFGPPVKGGAVIVSIRGE